MSHGVGGGPEAEDSRASLVRFIRESGTYAACDRGHMNLYQPFLERSLSLARPGGRVGLVLPWGMAVDDGAAGLRAHLFSRTRVDTIVGFDNADALFPIHRGVRFMVMVASPGGTPQDIRARFGVRRSADIDDLPERDDPLAETAAYPVRLSPGRLRVIGGPARRIPDARRASDLALLERIAATFPALGEAAGWSARFSRELNATEDGRYFDRSDAGRSARPSWLPVLEGKHIAPFVVDARHPAAHLPRAIARRLLPDGRYDRARLAYRDVSGVGNRLTLIAAVLPAGVVTTHTLFCLRSELADERQHFLCALLNSYVLNLVARMLMSGHLTTSLVEALPVPTWTGDGAQRRIARLAQRLARGPTTAAMAAAHLHAEVARQYGLDAPAFVAMLGAFPLIGPDDRERARRAFETPRPPRVRRSSRGS